MRDHSLDVANILIVDDDAANLKLLEDMLRQQGYEVYSFPRGRLALAAAEQKPPDLILLDINMPEMNGYELCERLKSTAALSDVPVIFLSALSEIEDKVKAFQYGAVDYLSKPFRFEEVNARVQTHLKLHELQRALKLQNERLEEAVATRTQELAEASRRLTILDRSKSDFLKLISHEFRTPLNGILGVGELILDAMPATEENNELQEMFKRSRRRILSILEDALLLTQIDVHSDQFRSAPVSLSTALRRATEGTTEFAESKEVIVTTPSADMGLILADENLLVRALQALIETAVKFSEKGGVVGLSSEVAAGSRRIIIESQGRTVRDAALGKFFELFSIGEALTPGGDLGVGPPLAYRILSLFGGSVSIANRDTAGIRLTITLRNATPNDDPLQKGGKASENDP
ncbi:MAG: hybrid sensor histidine kinase/response regulator [Bryobacteraceae bacterium]|jgi:two-component system, sensor histidine kinase and response regulator